MSYHWFLVVGGEKLWSEGATSHRTEEVPGSGVSGTLRCRFFGADVLGILNLGSGGIVGGAGEGGSSVFIENGAFGLDTCFALTSPAALAFIVGGHSQDESAMSSSLPGGVMTCLRSAAAWTEW